MSYLIGDFHNLDKLALICRGGSAIYLETHNDFSHCFVVGQIDNLMTSIGSRLIDRKIVHIINKVSIVTDKTLYERYRIKDIQCNFGNKPDNTLSEGKTALYKKVCSKNKHAKVHLSPVEVQRRKTTATQTWVTTGLFAVDLAAFFQPKNLYIYGLDFYDSDYLAREKINTSIAKNRRRADEMVKNFLAIFKRDKDIKVTLFTYSDRVKSQNNVTVSKVK